MNGSDKVKQGEVTSAGIVPTSASPAVGGRAGRRGLVVVILAVGLADRVSQLPTVSAFAWKITRLDGSRACKDAFLYRAN